LPTEFQIATVIGMQQSSFMALQTSLLAWGTIFTIVFAYLAALYFFLRHTGLVVRLMGFVAFMFVLVFLVMTTNFHFEQVQALLDAVLLLHEQGIVPQMDQMGNIHTQTLETTFSVMVWTFNIFFMLVGIAFAYLTFFYRWQTNHS